MRFLLILLTLYSFEFVLASGGASFFNKNQVSELPTFTPREVHESADLFIYAGFVYQFNKFKPDGLIPISHVGIFENIKNKDSTIQDTDVALHNEKLRQFLNDFNNVIGRIEF